MSENTSGPGTCSTGAATVLAETPAQPTAASRYVKDLGGKATGPKQPILSSFPKHQIGDVNCAFSPFYYHKFPWMEYSVSLDSVFLFLLLALFFKYSKIRHRRTVYKSGSSELEKAVGEADKTCFITGTFIKHGNVGELQTQLQHSRVLEQIC